MIEPKDDLLLKRYREASALDEARPSPALREAVLAQSRAAAASRTPSSPSPADHKTAFVRPAAANESRWAWRALGGLAVLGLVGLLVLEFERSVPEEHRIAMGSGASPDVAEPASAAAGPATAPAAAPASTARAPAPSATNPGQREPASVSEAPVPPAAPRAAEPAELTARAAQDAATAPASPSPGPGGEAAPATLEAVAPRAAAPPMRQEAMPPALIAAVQARDSARVQRLLDQGVQVNGTDSQGQTALMLAARHGDAALIRLLLDAGADVRLRNAQGLDAAAYAQHAGHAGVLPLLQEAPGR